MAHFKQKRLYLCFATAEFCDQNPSNISSFLKSFNADVCWEKEIEKKVSHKKVQVQRKLQKRSHDRRNLLTQLPISWWTIALTHSLYLYIYLPLSYLPTSLANIPTCISITLYLYTSLSVPIYQPISLSLYQYTYLPLLSLQIYLLFLSLQIYLLISLSLPIYLRITLSLPIYLPISISLYQYTDLPLSLSLSLSLSLINYFSLPIYLLIAFSISTNIPTYLFYL